ncbi:PAS domain-containing protein [Halomonas salinarum]|uniref:PAS domain-containing protein n=1 Tax=Halomonas salinarum TaxID=1158993 RepID=UPI001439A36C
MSHALERPSGPYQPCPTLGHLRHGPGAFPGRVREGRLEARRHHLDTSRHEDTTWTPLGSTFFPAEQPLRQGHPRRTEGLSERTATRPSRRSLAAALAAEKRWARAALGAIGDAVLTIDLRGTVTYMNRVAETLTGWSQRQAIGAPLSRVFPLVDGTVVIVLVVPSALGLR